jgi:hypothetical protein
MPILDYQKDYKKDKAPPPEIFRNTVKRAIMLNRYHKKNDVKLSGLMNQIVMRKLEEERKQEK